MYEIINLIGLLLIVAIIAWFWLMKSKTNLIKAEGLIEILVKDGVYKPGYIQAQVGQPITLRFLREDASPCSEVVVFPALNISQQLPLGKIIDVPLNFKNPGEYEFTCQMGMYRGKVVAK